MTAPNLVEVFTVHETLDEWGRKGGLKGIYRTYADAEIGARGKGWYGSDGSISTVSALEYGYDLYLLARTEPVCFEDVAELREAQRKAALAKVYAKLTEDELELLKGDLK